MISERLPKTLLAQLLDDPQQKKFDRAASSAEHLFRVVGWNAPPRPPHGTPLEIDAELESLDR